MNPTLGYERALTTRFVFPPRLVAVSRMINAIIGFHQADERRVIVCSNNQAIKGAHAAPCAPDGATFRQSSY